MDRAQEQVKVRRLKPWQGAGMRAGHWASLVELLEDPVGDRAVYERHWRPKSRPDLPEIALMRAIFEQAVLDLRGYGRRDHDRSWAQHRADARKWLASDDARWIYSFRNVCDTLGFDSASLRARLHQAT